ncbi:glucose-1-phosphate thymidylyltransferase, partial [bacterium]|nr:glucose-1-phosphate thymidylyltransferase [bacterium]
DEQASDLASTLKPSARGELEITDLNRLYLKQNNLSWMPLDSPDDLWFDVGTHEAMYLAIDKVSHLIIEKKIQIGCIEEQAFLNGWIEKPQLALLQKNLKD